MYVLFTGEDCFALSQHSLGAYSSLCRVEVPWALLHRLQHAYWCHPCLGNVWAVMLVRLYGYSF